MLLLWYLDFLSATLVVHAQEIAVLLVWCLCEDGLLPQIRRQIAERLTDGIERSLGKVAKSAGGASRASPAIVNTGHGQEFLWHRCAHQTSTSWSGDESHCDTRAFASHFAWHSVRRADLVTPVATSNGHNGQLGQNDGATNGGRHFFGALHAQTNVTIVIADGNDGLEACTLTGLRLLLYRLDLEHFILQNAWVNESVDDLGFL